MKSNTTGRRQTDWSGICPGHLAGRRWEAKGGSDSGSREERWLGGQEEGPHGGPPGEVLGQNPERG